MAKFVITKKNTAGDLKAQFAKEFGGTLRVYEGRSETADNTTLVSIGAKVGELECRASRTVGSFIEAFKGTFNLKVKVYTVDNWVAVLDGITLATVKDIPRQATKSSMEKFMGYKREESSAKAEKQQGKEAATETVKKKLYIGSEDTWAISYAKLNDADFEKIQNLPLNDDDEIDTEVALDAWRDIIMANYDMYYNNCIYAISPNYSVNVYESIDDLKDWAGEPLIECDDIRIFKFADSDWGMGDDEPEGTWERFPANYPEKMKSNLESWIKEDVLGPDNMGDAVLVEKLDFKEGSGNFAVRAVHDQRTKHCFEVEIELKKGEEFDPAKFALCECMTRHEPAWADYNEIDISSTLGAVYDGKWYPMKFYDGDDYETDGFNEKEVYAAVLKDNIFGEGVLRLDTVWKIDQGKL